MIQKGDFRAELDDHFDCDLNDENTYFMVIPMAIINEIAFFVSITPHTLKPLFSAIKKFLQKVNLGLQLDRSSVCNPRFTFQKNFLIAEKSGFKVCGKPVQITIEK